MSFDLKSKHQTEDKNAAKKNPSRFENVSSQKTYGGEILAWQGPEFESYPKSRRWYAGAFLIFLAIVAYALYTDSPIMAITFILIGAVGYIYITKHPRLLDFKITSDGVTAGRDLYEFDNIESFWIFYEPPHIQILSLKMKSGMLSHIHIPIHQKDPVEIRKILLDFIPEKKQNPSIIDVLERLLHI